MSDTPDFEEPSADILNKSTLQNEVVPIGEVGLQESSSELRATEPASSTHPGTTSPHEHAAAPVPESNVDVLTPSPQTLPTQAAFTSEGHDTPIDPVRKVDPMQGMKLEAILNELVAYFGWEEMGYRINIRCFNEDPSIGSSLKFLRKTPWARTKVDNLFLLMGAEQADGASPPGFRTKPSF